MRKLPAAAQEERRRQVIGLRESGLSYEAIAAQTGLSRTGVFDICRRYAEHGLAGLQSGPRGPASGSGRFLNAAQEAEIRAVICRQMPDEVGLPFALWSRPAVAQELCRALARRQALGQLTASPEIDKTVPANRVAGWFSDRLHRLFDLTAAQ